MAKGDGAATEARRRPGRPGSTHIRLARDERRAALLWSDGAELVALAFLACLYLLSPRSSDAVGGAFIGPTAAILTLFIAAVAARMAIDLRDRTHPLLPYAWAGADFVLLYALMFSYHLNYDAAAGVYLKATTADMAFVLIALRAVLFDARLIGVTAAFAVAGWAALTVYAGATAGPDGVTRSFVDYMTSDRVLIGAQIERILAMALMSGALILAITYGRRDPISRLSNRRGFLDRLERAVGTARRARRGALFVADSASVRLGAPIANDDDAVEAFRTLGARVRHFAEGRGFAGRFEQLRFAVFLNDVADEAAAQEAADELIRLYDIPFATAGSRVALRAHVGFALAADAEDAGVLLENAKTALSRCSDSPNCRGLAFRARYAEERADAVALENELRRAMTNDELALHYQTIVDLGAGGVRGVEALLRWRSATRGAVAPGDFIPIAEKSGLIVELGAWALKRAAIDQAVWRARGLADDVYVGVNVSAVQVDQWNGLEEAIEDVIEHDANVVLELTESVVSVDLDRAEARLRRLRNLGVGLAIDDFGTGYSSFAQLGRLPFSALKIDRSLTLTLKEPSGRATLQALARLGQGLGMTTVVEGVETREEANEIRRLGFHCAQGYFFARPSPADEVVFG